MAKLQKSLAKDDNFYCSTFPNDPTKYILIDSTIHIRHSVIFSFVVALVTGVHFPWEIFAFSNVCSDGSFANEFVAILAFDNSV